MDAIGVKSPHPRSTRHRVRRADGRVHRPVWSSAGKAYETSDGVYFAVESVPDYGKLARQDLDTFAGGRAGAGRRRQALAGRFRAVEAGRGRRLAVRGTARGGGVGRGGTPSVWSCRSTCWARDSTSTAAVRTWRFPTTRTNGPKPRPLGRPFAAHWVHNGFIEVGGEKMSKSLGNFTTLVDLIENDRSAGLPAAGAAGALPVAHRGHAGHHRERVQRARPGWIVWRVGAPICSAPSRIPSRSSGSGIGWTTTWTPRRSPLCCSGSLGASTHCSTRASRSTRRRSGRRWARSPPRWGSSCTVERAEVPPEVQALAGQRDQARAEKDWARADAIRDQLQATGWTVEDTADGTVVRPT